MLFIAKVNSLLVMWSPGRVPTGNWDWVGRRAGEEFMVGLDTPCTQAYFILIAS